MTPASRIVLTIGVLGLGVLAITAVFIAKPKPERKPVEVPKPAVSVVEARPSDINISVETQGTVTPKREIDLVPEVSGKVTFVSDVFIAGGFFEQGDLLIQIDARDYEFAVTRAEAQLASASQRLALEQAEADQARRDWAQLGEEGKPTPLVLREPQLADARAQLAAAQAQLDDARLDLERTRIRAPFPGRVREQAVDIGQYVTPGVPLGRVYSTDVVEIRLPLTDRQIGYLGLPHTPHRNAEPVQVIIKARFAGEDHEWDALIYRTEGAIDPRSRVLYAVAEVVDPFGLQAETAVSAPLSVGLFVEAEIMGRRYENIFVLPREALKELDQLILVNAEGKLEFQTVEVLRSTATAAYIQSGLIEGDLVMSSTLENPVDGMAVQVIGQDADQEVLVSGSDGAQP